MLRAYRFLSFQVFGRLKLLKHNRSLVFFAFIFMLCSPLLGQSEQDSLSTLLQTAQGLERAELLLEISSQTRHNDVEKAILQAKEAFAIAKRLDNEAVTAKSLDRLGFLNYMIDRDTIALENFLGALALNRQLGDRLSEAGVLHSLGRFYFNQGNYTKALEYFFQALRIRQDEGSEDAAANTMSYIGDVYRERKELEQAFSFFEKAVAIAKKTNNLREISISGVKAGNMLHQLGKFEKANQYFDLALEAAKNMESIHAQAGILLVMSSAYEDENLYEKALKLNHELLKIAKTKNNNILLARGYENIAGIYGANNNLNQSNEYYLKAHKLYEEINFPTLPVTINLMQNYLKKNKVEKAIAIGENALMVKKKTTPIQNRKAMFETLAAAYKKQGNYQEALNAQNKLIALNKQIFDTKKEKQIAEMQTRYETEQKEQEIKLLEKEQEKATLLRNALFAGIFSICIIALLVYNRQRLKIRKNRADMENIRLRGQQLQQDIEFKNKQITTHSLNLVQKNEVMKELKTRIAQLQEKSSEKTNQNLRSLNQLIDYSFNLDKDWEEFKRYFEEVHTGFFRALKKRAPELTAHELRLSALVKLNLTLKEISTLMAISPDSVKTARYRLRKKLELDSDQNLGEFMMNIEKQASA